MKSHCRQAMHMPLSTSFASSKETMLLLLLLLFCRQTLSLFQPLLLLPSFSSPQRNRFRIPGRLAPASIVSPSREALFWRSFYLCRRSEHVKFNFVVLRGQGTENISSQTSAEMANVSQPMLPKFAKSTADRTFFTKIFDSEPHFMIVFIISVALKPLRPRVHFSKRRGDVTRTDRRHH